MGGGGAQTPAGAPALTSASSTPVGLCESCLNTRVIETRTGSTFYMCELSAVDPTFPRYPRLPVLRCRGYRPAIES